MGLFSWLFGKRQRVECNDQIWLADLARSRGVAVAIGDSLVANRSVLVLAHFPAALAAFGELVVRKGWSHSAIPSELTPAAALKLAAEAPRVLFGLVRNLRPDEFPSETAPDSPLRVLVLERHFLRSRDDEVTRFAEGFGGRAKVDFHVSLEDPLLQLFAGEWLRNMLRRLGMRENETIQSGMVSRRIKAAQGKYAKTITTDHNADSPAEWLERNRAA